MHAPPRRVVVPDSGTKKKCGPLLRKRGKASNVCSRRKKLIIRGCGPRVLPRFRRFPPLLSLLLSLHNLQPRDSSPNRAYPDYHEFAQKEKKKKGRGHRPVPRAAHLSLSLSLVRCSSTSFFKKEKLHQLADRMGSSWRDGRSSSSR